MAENAIHTRNSSSSYQDLTREILDSMDTNPSVQSVPSGPSAPIAELNKNLDHLEDVHARFRYIVGEVLYLIRK